MASEYPPTENRRHWPRFSLRTLLLIVAAMCGLLSLATSLKPIWALVASWGLLMVAAHVAGNVSGTRRYRGPREMDEGPAFISNEIVHAPSTQLREHADFGRSMIFATLASALVGCLVGTTYLILGLRTSPPLLGLLVGATSSSIIGGLFGFLASSFLNVFRRALRQASGKTSHHRK